MNTLSMAHRFILQGLYSGRLSPSLLFVGQPQSGRLKTALNVAKYFGCQNRTEKKTVEGFPHCNHCKTCERMDTNNHSDLLLINRETQALIVKEKLETQTAIKIESIRHMDTFLRLRPTESERRMAIIEEANKMTLDAANALLKILEEPPPMAQIILITTDTRALPSTIASRCSIIRFPLATSTESLDPEPLDLNDYDIEEFFELISNTNWKREGRKQAEVALRRILRSYEEKWHDGVTQSQKSIQAILAARKQLDRNVSPRLVLENLYLELVP